MTALRAAAQQALEALDEADTFHRNLPDQRARRLTAITALRAALASSCDEQRHQLWESGGIAGCERARGAERQRDALLEALKEIDSWLVCACIATPEDMAQSFAHMEQVASAAIAAVEGGKT